MKRILIVLAAIILVIVVGAAVGLHFAVGILKDKIAVALGPGSELRELKVGWGSIDLAGLLMKGTKDWPAGKTLEAERVTIVPSLKSLFSDNIKIASITIDQPYLSAYRTPGKFVLLPSLLHPGEKKPAAQAQASARTVTIDRITLHDGVIEIFDATVRRPPLKTRLEHIEATVHDIVAPSLKEKAEFELEAVVKGKQRDGKAKISGWLAETGRDSSTLFILQGVDLIGLQPYLAQKGDVRIDKGSLDLNLKSEVRNNQLDGKGRLVIRELELGKSGGFMGTFMGMPRDAVVNSLKGNNGTIDIDFALKGDVTHPNFSLNEALSTRIAAGLAGQLGFSLKGLGEGVGSLGQKSVEGVGKAAGGVGSAVQGLFGGGEKKSK